MNDPKTKEANRAEDIGTSVSKPPDDPRVKKTDEYGNPLDGTPLNANKQEDAHKNAGQGMS